MEITLTFEHPLNHSLQVGDTVWYTEVSPSGGYDVAPTATKLGRVEEVSDQYQAHEMLNNPRRRLEQRQQLPHS